VQGPVINFIIFHYFISIVPENQLCRPSTQPRTMVKAHEKPPGKLFSTPKTPSVYPWKKRQLQESKTYVIYKLRVY